MGKKVYFVALQLDEQSVGHILDVLGHESRVHTDQVHRQSVRQKLLLYFNGILNDLVDARLARFVDQVSVHEAGEIGVKTLLKYK